MKHRDLRRDKEAALKKNTQYVMHLTSANMPEGPGVYARNVKKRRRDGNREIPTSSRTRAQCPGLVVFVFFHTRVYFSGHTHADLINWQRTV